MSEDEREKFSRQWHEQKAAEHGRLVEAEPWRAIMADVGKIMQAALEEAQDIAEKHREYATKYKELSDRPRKLPGTDSIVRLAVAIFDATVQAEGGRRMIEAQSGLVGGTVIPVGKDGRPLKM